MRLHKTHRYSVLAGGTIFVTGFNVVFPFIAPNVSEYLIPVLTVRLNLLQWRHNGRDGVSDHQPHYCLLNRLFRRR